MTTSLIETLEAWGEDNPLRKHRRRHRISIVTAASMIGVSVNTIAKWESGASTPKAASLRQVEQFIGRAIAADWTRWLKCKPRTKPAEQL